jgi:hypothetical protein
MVETGPIYCLSRELLRSLQNTDTSNLAGLIPEDWMPPLPVLIIALPDDAIKTPSGGRVSYLSIGLSHPAASLRYLLWENCNVARINITFRDSDNTLWTKISELGASGLIHGTQNLLGTNSMDSIKQDWLEGIVAIAMQCVMALSYLPELISESNPETPGKGFSKQKPQANKFLSPRWIGKDFISSAAPAQRPNATGSHRSPIPHLRRGHWQQQAVGPQRQNRVPTWIRPAIINANPD